MNPHYPLVARRAGNRCEYCRAPEVIFNLAFEVEHILPRSTGGDDTPENLGLACRACNLYKSDRHEGLDPETGTVVPLFHPRRDAWSEHFRVQIDDGSILGLTPTGRATIDRLRMNRDLQREARRAWTRLGLFP